MHGVASPIFNINNNKQLFENCEKRSNIGYYPLFTNHVYHSIHIIPTLYNILILKV